MFRKYLIFLAVLLFSAASVIAIEEENIPPLETKIETKKSKKLFKFKKNTRRTPELQFELKADTSERTEPEATRLSSYLQESDYLTGDWLGARTYLEDHGVDIQSSLIMNPMVFGQGRGETRRGKGAYQSVFILSTELDTEKMGLYKGGKFFIEYMAGNKGTSPTDYLGSYSYINAYDPGEKMNQISQLYYEHTFKDDLFSLKIGKQDAGYDFQFLENGTMFLNASYYFIPNSPIPIYPAPQMGARAKLKVTENVYVQAGIYDGETKLGAGPKGFFTGDKGYVTLAETYWLPDFKGYEGKYMVGSWLQSGGSQGGFENLRNPDSVKNYNHGAYFGFEQKAFHIFEDKSGGLSLFGQFGYAPDDINEVPYYSSLGLVWKGVTKERKEDSIGLALAWHQYSNILKNLENKTGEKVAELFYRFKVTNFLYIQPGIQYIIRPGGNGEGSFALGARTELKF